MKYLIIFMLFFSSSIYAQQSGPRSLALYYGIADSSSDAEFYDGIDGSVMGLTYGIHTSPSFSWELSARRVSFDKSTAIIDLSVFGAGVTTLETEPEVLSFNAGFRWYFMRYFNVHAGAGYASVDSNFEASSTDPSAAEAFLGVETDDSGLGIYYGLGVQMPLGRIQLIADYTINQFSSDVASKEIVGGVRFFF